MGKGLILAAVLAVGLFGCQPPAPAPIADPRQVWCEENTPRRPSIAVVMAMSRAELDEMNGHNDRGVEWCGWQP